MSLSVRPLAALALLTSLLACSSDSTGLTESQQTAARLKGTWSRPNGFPGTSFTIFLDTQDTTVTGTGFFSYEAGPAGTLTVTGTVSGNTVDLDVVYTITDQHEHFRGEVFLDTFSGDSWPTPVGDPAPFELHRAPPPPGANPV